MKSARSAILIALIGVSILFLRRLRQWAGNPPTQRTSHKEAIEPPELVARYSRFMALLPMRVVRGYLARYATAGSTQWRILDVGCGPGWFPLELAACAPQATVTGIDLSLPMLTTATAHAATDRHEQAVHFAQARGEVLPFADDTFDLVVSTLALHHVQDPVAALAELRRVAQPSGRILVADTRRDIHPWLWTLLKASQVGIDGLALCENGEPSASIGASYTASEAHRLALQAGWERARVQAGPGWILLERLPTQATTYPVPPTPRRKRNGRP
ncbi:MAG: class I SAM-dependent methyltransferase [Chloroflexi bacterium]|nr:class I SAM-dependent methyltransferase [Chloroflexota bacterium]